MSAFPGSPRILKGGIVLIDAASSAVLRVIASRVRFCDSENGSCWISSGSGCAAELA